MIQAWTHHLRRSMGLTALILLSLLLSGCPDSGPSGVSPEANVVSGFNKAWGFNQRVTTIRPGDRWQWSGVCRWTLYRLQRHLRESAGSTHGHWGY